MALVIPLQIEGTAEFMGAFRGMARVVREFRDEVASLRRELKTGLPGPSRQGGGGSGSGSGGGGRSSGGGSTSSAGGSGGGSTGGSTRKPPVLTGPAARLQQASMRLQQAMASGDPTAIFDAQHGYHQAQQRFQRARKAMMPRTFMDAAKDAIMSSRAFIGAGGGGLMGGVAPVLGRIIPLLAKAGPIGVAVAALALIPVVTAGLIKAADALSRATMAVSQQRYAAGATYGQTGRMFVLGQALGVDIAQAARGFADNIAQGGYASGFWRQYGVSDVAGPYGKVNKMDNLERAIQVLSQLPEAKAIQVARASGLEGMLPLRDADPKTLKELLNMQRKLTDPAAAKAAMEFQLALAKLKLEIQALVPKLTPFVRFVTSLAEVVGRFIGFLGRWGQAMMYMNMAMVQVQTLNFRGAAESAKKAWRQITGEAQKAENASRDRNTEAIQENTRELRQAREILGGGQRAAGAIPGGWRYQMINNQLDQLGQALGSL